MTDGRRAKDHVGKYHHPFFAMPSNKKGESVTRIPHSLRQSVPEPGLSGLAVDDALWPAASALIDEICGVVGECPGRQRMLRRDTFRPDALPRR